MSDQMIATEHRGTIFEIVLNRPEKRNALNWDMLKRLPEAVGKARRASDVRVIVVRGAGKGFSAGIDLNAFFELPGLYGSHWRTHMREVTEDFQGMLTSLTQIEIPTIAVLHGFVLGLGLELALACDLRVAAEDTLLGLPETRLGLIPDVGGSTRLAQLVGLARAKELIFTGRQINAGLAERWGLLNRVVPADQLDVEVHDLVREIEQAAPLAVGMAKRVLNGMLDTSRGLALEGWAQSQLIGSEDFGEGVQAMLQKRAPKFRGV